MTRTEIRDSAFKIIFEKLLRDDELEELYDIAKEMDEIIVNDKVKELVEGTLAHSDEFDEIINRFSIKRDVSRIAKVNIAILKLALYEMIYDDKTPVNAAISEAIHLSETYSQKEDTAFINGILGAFSRSEYNKEATKINDNIEVTDV
ncbi:MAG: transcription antitermination factor NusB [Clostridiales bacterium]|jgi:N utilization substance protein B|nr:transcription antitermination factor NusB [Clostridiales bacterium]